MKRFFDKSMLIFLAIGAGNTLISQLLMQVMYNALGYWASSAIAFALTSVISYILNKRLSFHNEETVGSTVWKFILVIGVCYALAYWAAQPATAWLLDKLWPGSGLPVDRIALLTGQVLFTALNYLGQRYFAFKTR